jgi:hypothetical protein
MISYKKILKYWDKFFFEPLPTESIALFRILWCSLIGIYFLLDLQNINDFYGPHALLSLQTVKSQFPYMHLNVFHSFNSSYEMVYSLMTIYGISILFALFGFYTRTSLLIMFICMTSIHQRNIWLLSSSELLLRAITLYLICSPCGHSLSIDSILGRKYSSFKKNRDWAPWALRLIQIQISVVYLWTVWHKLKGEDWLDGTAVYYATRLEGMKNFSLSFLLDSEAFIKLATWGTLLVEVSLGILIWIKEFRKPVIILGIIFHLGIEITMSIPFFEVIMIFLLMLYITPLEVRVFSDSFLAKLSLILNDVQIYPKLKTKIQWMMRGHYAEN